MTLDQGEDRGSFGSRGSSHLDALRDSAPAKINLTLEVKGKRADGYHELESLVLFADFGDELEYRPAADFSLTVDGPFSEGLAGGDNLVQRAASAYAERYGQRLSGRFRLRKQLPVAAGLGGGSSDAAATLRILRKLHGVPGDLTALVPLARDLGADIPCCLHARAAIMTGIGETLHPLPASERIPALLVNPMRPLATADVFRELGAGPLEQEPAPFTPPALGTKQELIDYAAARGNDLEPPARRLLPMIDEVLESLRAAPGALLARLSGSGPTCFAVFAETHEAQAAARAIAQSHPRWWGKPVSLG
jgi:4-diphosphocytidyl-2-C-methyl-D-erythritol kinase